MAPSTPPSSSLPAFYRFAPLLVFLAVTVINFLPLGEDRFNDDIDTLFSAAGYAFSIWGLIFLGMIGFSVVLAKAKEPDTPPLRRAVLGLLVAGIASILFVPISIAGNQVYVFLDVVVHLLGLIYAYGNLRQHVVQVPARPRKRGFWFYGPSMYMGWISAATVIGASLALSQLGLTLSVGTSTLLVVILLVVLFVIGQVFLTRADAVYACTVAWALVAVGVEQGSPSIRYTAWAAAFLLVATAVVRVLRGKFGFYATPGYSDAQR